jgi:N-formylglutamate amidohydrolase
MEGTLMGAIAGALVSVELADSLVTIWCCDECSLDTRIERTVRALSGLVVLADAHSGRGRAERGGDIFQPSFRLPAMAAGEAENLPVTKLTEEAERAGQTTCPICLHVSNIPIL